MKISQISLISARIALFVIYFWFGLLKVLGVSPASPLVEALANKTMPEAMPFSLFIILFGLFEILIGLLFIIPKAEKIATVLFFVHMITTTMPLFLVSGIWSAPFVPTLEGQYIIKNLALIACVLFIWDKIQSVTAKNNG